MDFVKVRDLSVFSKAVMPHMKRGVLTNFFLSPDKLAYEIAEERLYISQTDGALLILRKRDGLSILGFYLDQDFEKLPDGCFDDMTVVCEIFMPDENLRHAAERLLARNGFDKILTRVKLSAQLYNTCLYPENVTKVNAEDAKRVAEILSESLPVYTGCVPLIAEIGQECEKGLVYGVYDGNNLVGVLKSTSKKTNAEIKHLAVCADARNKGYAKALLSAFVADNNYKTLNVMTGEDNLPALKLYNSFGFTDSNERSAVYAVNTERKS